MNSSNAFALLVKFDIACSPNPKLNVAKKNSEDNMMVFK